MAKKKKGGRVKAKACIDTDDFVCVCVIEICEGVLHWCRSYLDPFYLSLCRLGRVLVFLSSFL